MARSNCIRGRSVGSQGILLIADLLGGAGVEIISCPTAQSVWQCQRTNCKRLCCRSHTKLETNGSNRIGQVQKVGSQTTYVELCQTTNMLPSSHGIDRCRGF